MTRKPPGQTLVEFYAAAPRLADACQRAIGYFKGLDQFSRLHVVRKSTNLRSKRKSGRLIKSETVALWDINSDCHWPRAVSGSTTDRAFHVLFIEADTHPQQIVQWTRTANLCSEERLHVVKADWSTNQPAQFIGRLALSFSPDKGRGGIVDAFVVDNSIYVRGRKHRMLHVPVDALPALRNAASSDLRNFTIDEDGSFLYWPTLDVHLGWDQFLQSVDPDQHLKAQQRSADFNRRYGAAIRAFREASGLHQTDIPGLTPRHLRRIELGHSRATSKALSSLAAAHHLPPNEYLNRLANLLSTTN